MFRTIHRYEENGLGLPYPIILVDAAEEELNESGDVIGISVPNMEGLVAAVTLARVLDPLQLDGVEVRFIRKVIGLTAKDFAESLTMDAATLSRWENNKQTVGDWADKQVRMAAVISLADRVPGLTADPKAVIALRCRPRASEADWPAIEMHLVPAHSETPEQPEAWDTIGLAA